MPDSNDDMPRNSQQHRAHRGSAQRREHHRLAAPRGHPQVPQRRRRPPARQGRRQSRRSSSRPSGWCAGTTSGSSSTSSSRRSSGRRWWMTCCDDRPRERFFQWRNEPFIPVEFAVAAYRFGHSQVRPGLRAQRAASPRASSTTPWTRNCGGPERSARGQASRAAVRGVGAVLRRTRRLHAGANPSKRIDARISTRLFELLQGPPGQVGGDGAGTITNPESLAQRNLLRSLALRLPSGQAMAQAPGHQGSARSSMSCGSSRSGSRPPPRPGTTSSGRRSWRRATRAGGSGRWARASWPRSSSACSRATGTRSSTPTRTGGRSSATPRASSSSLTC